MPVRSEDLKTHTKTKTRERLDQTSLQVNGRERGYDGPRLSESEEAEVNGRCCCRSRLNSRRTEEEEEEQEERRRQLVIGV